MGIPKGKIDYARYEGHRRNIIALLRACMWQEVLHRVRVGGEGVSAYEAGKNIHEWTEDELDQQLENEFLIPLSPEDPPITLEEIRHYYNKAVADCTINAK